MSESGPDHKRVYERAVYVGDRLVATGKGKNQKIADSNAAEAALEILKGESVDKSVDLDAISKLKGYAAKNKQPSPEFRDLGETPTSDVNSREYIIECRCMGQAASAIGRSKREARALAAVAVIELLTPKKEKKEEKSVKIKTKQKDKKTGAHKARINKNARKSDKSSSPKKQSYQHKKHL